MVGERGGGRRAQRVSIIVVAAAIIVFVHADYTLVERDKKMDELATRVLNLFSQMNSDTLDLHALFEAGGNDPDAREQVLDAVAQLVREGLLEERGSDFYSLTFQGRAALGH